MSLNTRGQRMAQAAFPCVEERQKKLGQAKFKEYTTFAKKFPSLIHSCGLAQAVAFAWAKDEKNYLEDLRKVLVNCGHTNLVDLTQLETKVRTCQLGEYFRLSRDAIKAAGWLKRYVEAVEPETNPATP